MRILRDTAYLYATHDRSPDNTCFAMDDRGIRSSPDLANWPHECILRPEQTYHGQPDAKCCAVNAIDRDGSCYFYLLARVA